ncbi:hypothetical protein, partial [Flavobacterium sp. UMI-01]|uniref:hypothetical protein n=1 Tax=Flavobacterium sp. UMI-01 TaxID=1441053 RepID=UPI001C7D83C5
DGTISAGTVTGGNGTNTYSIDNTNFTNTTGNFTGLAAGAYTLYVKDAKGCIASQTVTIATPAVLAISGSTTTPVSCNGALDGTISAGTVTGGNSTNTYSIDNTTFTNTTGNFTGLAAGAYTLYV